MSNEPKPEDEMSEGRTMDTDLDAAIRELDRFRRETWTLGPAAGHGEAGAARNTEKGAGEATDHAPRSAPTAAPDATRDERSPDDLGPAWSSDDNDDDLFDPEPVAPTATAPEEHGSLAPPEHAPAASPTGEAAYDETRFDAPAAEQTGADTGIAAEAGLGGLDPATDAGEARRVDALSDFDGGFDDEAAILPPHENAPVTEGRLPQASRFSLFTDAAPPAEPAAAADGDFAAPAGEPVTLPRRMFGLKRALDAHRLGVSVDELPGDIEPRMPEQAASDAPVAPAETVAETPAPERKSWFAAWRAAEPQPETAAAEPEAAQPEPEVREPEVQEPEPEPAAPSEPEAMVSEPQAAPEMEAESSALEVGSREPEAEPAMAMAAPEPEPTVIPDGPAAEPEIIPPEPPAAAEAAPEPIVLEAIAVEPGSVPEPPSTDAAMLEAPSAIEPDAMVESQDTGASTAASVGTAALAAGAAAAALPAARRWFGSRKTPATDMPAPAPAPAPAEPPLAEAATAAPPVEPPAKANREGWFGWRRKKEPGQAAEASASEAAAQTADAGPASAAKSEDPFAAMTAAIGAAPEPARKGWFGSKPAPAPETAPASGMVDLAPVREAMAAAALKRSEGAEPAAAPIAVAETLGEAPAANPADAARVGVLLVNLGTPDSTKPRAVRRYLREFLSDRRVIEKDTFTWQFVLRCIILPFRPRSKARAYRTIWNREKNESPLKTITRAQAKKLGDALARTGSDAVVDWAMRYGNPPIGERIRALIAQGSERLLVVPLYPQYSSATTATVCDETFRVLSRLRNQPSVRIAPPYYADPTYIEAVAATIESELARLPFAPEVVLASYHGMPLEYVQKGDPYLRHCTRTTELLRERLGMAQSTLMMTFQSRFGRAEWLQPYTDETLRKLAKDGVRSVAVVTPGFAADCLETLEEIAVENAHIFKKRGGKNFAFIPCLNDGERGMAVIRAIAARELKGWVEKI